MRRLLQILALALAGYIVYELIRRWMSESGGQEWQQQAPRPLGKVQGAAVTSGGRGAVQRTLGHDGSSVSERVGRGVVRRNRQEQG